MSQALNATIERATYWLACSKSKGGAGQDAGWTLDGSMKKKLDARMSDYYVVCSYSISSEVSP